MMEKLLKRGIALAEQKRAETKSEVKAALINDLPEHVSIDESDEGIIVRSPRLEQDIIDHSSLRDVAFLMRGVR